MANKVNHFMSITVKFQHSRTYGWNKITLKLYKIEGNVPIPLFTKDDKKCLCVTYTTGSTRGESSEVMNALAKEGYLNASLANSYYNQDEHEDFVIHCL